MEQQKTVLTELEKQQQLYIKMQEQRLAEKDETIAELKMIIDDLRSMKTNLEETLEEFRRQFLE